MNRSLVIAFFALLIVSAAACQTPEQKAAEYDKYFSEGWKLTTEGNFLESISYYQKAIQALPNDPKATDAYINLGWSLQKTGDLQGATTAYEKALKLSPNNTRARNNLDALRQQAAAGQPSP